jgi:hypothetical protein
MRARFARTWKTPKPESLTVLTRQADFLMHSFAKIGPGERFAVH